MKKLLPVLLLLLIFSGCGETKKTTDTVFAMDTVMTLTVYGDQANNALAQSRYEILRLEKILSVTDPESQIAGLNQGSGQPLSSDTYGLICQALEIAALTGGAYDPTVYPLMELWGFYHDDFSVPSEDDLQSALSHTGYTLAEVSSDRQELLLPEGAGIDLGGIAKGYASEKVIETMYSCGASAAVISLGGNVGLLGTKPDGSDWVVAVEKPDGSGETVAKLSIPGAYETYVVTSGAYQRYFEEGGVKYHHILDPETGFPAETDLLSVTIVCENGVKADALSTALFVMGFEEAVAYWRSCLGDTDPFDVVLITEKGIFASEGLNISAQIPLTLLEAQP